VGNVVSVRLRAEPRADSAQSNIEVVNIVGVDPRDQTWEVDAPRYRVYFHERSGASDEYEISGANVAEVLTWAEEERRGRTLVLYVCAPTDGLGLLRLAGTDPNAAGVEGQLRSTDSRSCRRRAAQRSVRASLAPRATKETAKARRSRSTTRGRSSNRLRTEAANTP